LKDSAFDKDIAIKLNEKLNQDPEFNKPSITKPDHNDPDSK
jgi:hypothetical protein